VKQSQQQTSNPVNSDSVVRFPRTWEHTRKSELIGYIQEAHRRGDKRSMQLHLIDLQELLANAGSGSYKQTWDTVPRFNPTRVASTKWLIERFLAEETIQLIFGMPGGFKSTLMLCAAKAVLLGEDFLGMKVRRRRVLILDYENPAAIIKSRVIDLGIDLQKNRDLIVWDRFTDGTVPRPGDPRLLEIVRDCVVNTGHGPWIIFDSWSSLLEFGQGGETTGQIAPTYMAIRKLVDSRATCTVLDHSKKYESDVLYGGADKVAKSDTRHGVTVHENPIRPHNPIVLVNSWLKRFAPDGDGSFAFEVVSSQDEKGAWHLKGIELAADPVKLASEKKIQILRDLIRKNPDNNQSKLARLAVETGEFAREETIKALKAGLSRHWTASVGAKGKLMYELI